MSELNDDLPVQDELATLKKRADQLGVPYHPSIGLEKLKEKLAAALKDEPVTEAAPATTATEDTATESIAAKRNRLRKEALALVRIRLTCMNPLKKEWDGEVFTAGNSLVGSHTKYVPFNADDGWHVPRIIYNQIVQRQCQVFYSAKGPQGQTIRKGKLIKEFAVEVLPPLSEAELKELSLRQARTRAVD